MNKEKYILHVLIFLTIILWSSAFVAVRFAINDYTPGNLALLRYLTASVILIPFAVIKKIRMPSVKDIFHIAFLGLLGITFYNILFNEGMRSITAGSASFLLNTVPLFTASLAVIFLKEKLNMIKWAGLVISFAGVSLIAIGEKGGFKFNLGAVLLLSAAFSQASYIIVQKFLLKKYTGLELGFYTIWFGTIFLLGYLPGLLANIPTAKGAATFSVIYLGIFPAAMGYIAWSLALEMAAASYVVTFIYFVPLLTLIISKIWINETPAPVSIFGGVIIITGIIIVKIRPRKKQNLCSSENIG